MEKEYKPNECKRCGKIYYKKETIYSDVCECKNPDIPENTQYLGMK